MNTRERFLEVMRFNRQVAPVKWEFGYWGGTINNWYAQGLPRRRYPEIPTEVTTPTSTLDTPSTSEWWIFSIWAIVPSANPSTNQSSQSGRDRSSTCMCRCSASRRSCSFEPGLGSVTRWT